jgi:hypothetical protein
VSNLELFFMFIFQNFSYCFFNSDLREKNGYSCLKTEDEPHFLLDCNLFKINNDKIRLFMEREVPNFNFMDIKQQSQWEITPIVQCWNSYRALQIKET